MKNKNGYMKSAKHVFGPLKLAKHFTNLNLSAQQNHSGIAPSLSLDREPKS